MHDNERKIFHQTVAIAIILFLLLVIIFILLSGKLEKPVKVTYEECEVVVVDAYYRNSYRISTITNNTASFLWYPAEYKILVEYNGTKYTIDKRSSYTDYKDKIGQTITATLKTCVYADNSVKYNII